MFGSPQADAAVIAGILTLVGAIFTHWRTARLQRELNEKTATANLSLESLKDSLASRRDEQSARRDYEYQARKRLYAEIAPLLFQLCEAAEHAYHRALSLARTSRNGNLAGPDGWLAHEGYYLRSTIYNLLLPAVFFRLIQKKMTFVDLDVDDTTRIKYELSKLYYIALTDHFEFARLKPRLEYRPDDDKAKGASNADQAIFSQQGLVLGYLDEIVEAMIDPATQRAITFGDFDKALNKRARSPAIKSLIAVFKDFEPKCRPVLSRAVIALAVLARVLMHSYRDRTHAKDIVSLFSDLSVDDEVRRALAWSKGKKQDFAVLEPYFERRLTRVRAKRDERHAE